MAVELNHTIVVSSDKRASATFLAELLDLEVGEEFGPFVPVTTGNGVTLDYAEYDEEEGGITPQHYAFLVSEDEFDVIFGRIKAAGLTYYADPYHGRVGEINTRDGGRGTYFDDPDGHAMEILTRPYGSGGRTG
jgi:catechol 2,3-dioxygenase-like lactoylglutathione lyase family enzyme